MKRLFLFLFLTVVLITSCENEHSKDSDTKDSVENSDLENLGDTDMNEFSFASYGLNLSILLPEVASHTGASIQPTVTHDDGDFIWNLDIGNNFKLVIEDFGREKNKIIEEKKYLEGQKEIFLFDFIIDEPKVIMYKRELHADQGGKKSYHCYGEMKVDGYTIVIRTNSDGGFKPVVLDMVTIIKSAKEIKKG